MKQWWAMTCALALVAFTTAGHADNNDTRTQLVHYLPDHPTVVRLAPGTGVLIMLERSEHIETIHLSDPSAYQINVAVVGDSLFLKQTRSLPQAVMAIDTDKRRYEFSLIASEDLYVPYLVHFSYSDPTSDTIRPLSALPQPSGEPTNYKLRGSRALRPQSIVDNGERTFIKWAHDQLIPAVFAIDRLGNEGMVDGYMRDGVFTIDRVYDQLVFRIDNAAMIASRQSRKRKNS